MGARATIGRRLGGPVLLLAIGGCAISFGGYELEEGDAGATGASSGSSVGGAAGASSTGASGANGTDASVATGAGGTVGVGGAVGAGGTVGMGGSVGAGGIPASGASGSAGNGGAAGNGGRDASAGAAGSSGSGPAGAAGMTGSAGAAGNGGARDGGGGGMAPDGSTDGGIRGCPLLPGSQLIEIPLPAGAPGAPGRYCIDQTEVTNRQYDAFLATNPSTVFQPLFCSWNTSFAPATMAGAENCPNAIVYDPITRADYPAACVDWCDAYAYCRSIGKNLCRAFGGGSVPAGKAADATSDEWYAACSVAGAQKFPYGNTYQSTSCNMDSFGAPGTIRVQLAASCRAPDATGNYSYLYDLNGNVAEWEDACIGTVGAADNCNVRGGSFLSFNSPDPTKAGDCIAAPASARSRRSNQIGFRCCYDGN